MKQCPNCKRIYEDDTLVYCLDDGNALSAPYDSMETLINAPVRITDARTEVLPVSASTRQSADTMPYGPAPPRTGPSWASYVIIALLALIAGGGLVAIITLKNSGDPRENATLQNSPDRSNNNAVVTSDSPPNKNVSNTAKTENSATPNIESPSAAGGTWFVILGSFSKSERPRAEERQRQLQQKNMRVDLIDTDNYPGLAPGLWAVVMGPMPQSEAQYLADQLGKEGEKVYIKSGW